ncbi:MAG TPA: EamA/RhaT family transporter, partial [Actinomycetes bacterium]
MTALLALFSSALWGGADFIGGTLSRRIHALAVVGTSQAL